MTAHRPSPEKLLARAQDEERRETRGKLKIYLGSAPGVGKTYSMLHDALAQRSHGLDVVIGVVESHGRKEIEELLTNFEIIPRLRIDYRGRELKEFDLDSALNRNPGLILMDEMAHTNAPDLRHTKRWQDIKEILDRGIDVYTTLNVQHVESLNDVISQIIHTRVQETVPDSMLEMADTIELVDLPPEDLLKRLQEGKVYIPQQAELAVEHFFRKGNLSALRELALRVTAERVNAQVLMYRQGLGIKHIWPTKEKILVCISYKPESAKLIRAARRMANKLQAEWIALHVETPKIRLSEEQSKNAALNLRLAEKLGAKTRIITGFDVVKEITSFAREQNITMIMIWKHVHTRWHDWIFGSLADELIRASEEIDVHIITSESHDAKPVESPAINPTPIKRAVQWGVYLIALATVVTATLVDFYIRPYSSSSNLVMVYLLGVTFVALFGELGPAVMASLCSVLLYDFFFLPPFYSLMVSDFQSLFTLLVMLLVTQVISQLTVRTRKQVETARVAEHYTAALHTLSRQLASTRGIDKLLATALRYVGEVFDSDTLVFLLENNHLIVRAAYGSNEVLSSKELGVAQWVYDLGEMAGLGTDTLPFSTALYVPLLASQGVIGVLRICPLHAKQIFTSEQMHLLEACANQIALALEVDRLQEQTRRSELQLETNRARNVLLQTVSHDLRTPIIAALGAASTLMEKGDKRETAGVKKLASEIYIELEQLNRLISNLLQMTYLDEDSVTLQIEPHSLAGLIDKVLTLLKVKLNKKPVHLNIAADLPEVSFDSTLIQEVLVNLIDNAIKFTPATTAIEISVVQDNDNVRVSVEDHGPGIMTDEVGKLFEKFYRGRMLTSERGLGLGLAICHGIIKAHGGKIWAENKVGGGAAFRFTLPLHTPK